MEKQLKDLIKKAPATADIPKLEETKPKVEPKKKKETPVFDYLKRSAEPAVVEFTDEAMTKMLSIIMLCDKEVAWHGSARRLETGRYIIDDVYLYPQNTSAASVRVTDEKYSKWCVDEVIHNIDRAKSRHFHGHSHVNMGCVPSGVDRDYQDDTIEMIQEGDFYIFAIINKKLNTWFKIVDRVDNVYYETAGHNITINTSSNGLQDICKDYIKNVNDQPVIQTSVRRVPAYEEGYPRYVYGNHYNELYYGGGVY